LTFRANATAVTKKKGRKRKPLVKPSIWPSGGHIA